MNKPNIQAVIFDLDGTLVDSVPDLHAASEKLLAELGAEPLDQRTIRSFVGNGVPRLVELVSEARGLPLDPQSQSSLVADFLAFYDAELTDRTILYPGVQTCLETLYAAGVALAVCSNKPELQARQVLINLGLEPLFETIIGGDSSPERKPSPKPLLAAVAYIAKKRGRDVTIEECLYVGDSEVDAATADASGLSFALHKNGYRKCSPDELTHDFSFEHFDQLTTRILAKQHHQVFA